MTLKQTILDYIRQKLLCGQTCYIAASSEQEFIKGCGLALITVHDKYATPFEEMKWVIENPLVNGRVKMGIYEIIVHPVQQEELNHE